MEHNIPLRVKRLTEDAFLPFKGSVLSAGKTIIKISLLGYDLKASEDIVIKAKNKGLVSTGLAFEIPAGTYGRIAPRSGLAVKNFIDVGAGVIDSDYRGEVKVLLFNFGDEDFEVTKGERICQMIIERIALTKLVEVDELTETKRGEGGFGSTGTN